MALGMTVRDMLTRMDAKEMTDWIAFWNMEPWGDERSDFRSGVIASTVANVMSSKGRSFTPQDFMLNGNRRRQSEASMRAVIKAVKASWNPEDKNG